MLTTLIMKEFLITYYSTLNTKTMNDKFYLRLLIGLLLCPFFSYSQRSNVKDTVIYNITYRDTIIYRYETVQIKQYIYSDTVSSLKPIVADSGIATRKKRTINPYNWGIGPSVGAYYSPYHGFDINVGFGVQYYILSVPNFRNPHMGNRRHRK
jgi:hypothetical protein